MIEYHLVKPSQFHCPIAKQLGMLGSQMELVLAQCHEGPHLDTCVEPVEPFCIIYYTLLGTRL